MAKQRISYVRWKRWTRRCARKWNAAAGGHARPESSAVRAHSARIASGPLLTPGATSSGNGVCDHSIKELCRLYVSRSVPVRILRQSAGSDSRRPLAASSWRITSGTCAELRDSPPITTSAKSGACVAEAITWHLNTVDAFWDRLTGISAEPSWIELGCFIALTMGQQSWLRLLNIDHHQCSPAPRRHGRPGFEDDAGHLPETKASRNYWAKVRPANSRCLPRVHPLVYVVTFEADLLIRAAAGNLGRAVVRLRVGGRLPGAYRSRRQ